MENTVKKGEIARNKLYGTYFLFKMHFKMLSAICLNLDQSKILSSGNGLKNCLLYISSSYNVNPFPKKPWFLCVCSTNPLKTLQEKEKLLVTSNFSFSHSVFYLFGELFAISNELEIVVCKLFQFGRV